jgi:hypothetical protein
MRSDNVNALMMVTVTGKVSTIFRQILPPQDLFRLLGTTTLTAFSMQTQYYRSKQKEVSLQMPA